MPTYRNNRSSALFLSVPSGALDRQINSGETFTAHPSEVPVGWLATENELGEKIAPVVTKVSDLPDVPEPRKPPPVDPPAAGNARTIEQLREELKAESLRTELILERMRQENASLLGEAVKAAASAQQPPVSAPANTTSPSSPAAATSTSSAPTAPDATPPAPASSGSSRGSRSKTEVDLTK